VYTTDTGTVTNTMLAGSIANNKLANSTISGVALGSNLATLTMGVSGTGLSGSQTYNGSGAATFTVTSNATSANTASTIVARDGSGNFTAGTITAALSGNATTATTAGALTSMNISQFTNNSGYITGLSFDGLSSKGSGTGTYTTSGDFRAPIFYDSNDTSYYVNPNSTSVMNAVNYWGVQFWNGDGVYARGTNSHGYRFNNYADTINAFVINNSGDTTSYASSRAPIFYDSNDTTFYVNPNSKSELQSLDLGYTSGQVYTTAVQGTLFFNNHGESDIQGYSIGTTLENYNGNYTKLTLDWHTGIKIGAAATYGGIRFYNNSVKYYGGSEVFSVARGDSNVRVENILYVGSDVRSPIFYDSGDTGYYLNANGGSYLYGLQLSGNSYFRPMSWIQLDSTYGLYWPNHYSAHLYANTGSSYTQIRLDGSKGGYDGMWLSYSSVHGMMYDSGGNGGVYREANGRWYFYYHLGNACMGIGTSSTSSTYGVYVVKGGYFDGRVDGTIFYDANNTSYYCDPNGTARLSYVVANGGIRIDGNENLYLDYNYGCSIVGAYASTRYQGVFAMGNSYKLPIDGTSTGNLYGIAWSHPNAGGVAGNMSSHGLLVLINGGFGSSMSYNVVASSDVRGTIFYDYNNTGYYVDPNDFSRMGRIDPNEIYNYGWFRNHSDTGWYSQAYGYGAWWAHSGGQSYGNVTTYGTGRNGWSGWGIGSRHTFMSTTGDNVGVHDNSRGWIWYWNGSYTELPYGYTIMGGSARSPIFYDQNDTGYYVDPASTSYMYRTIFQGRMLFYGADQSADGTNDAQIYFTPGGGLTIASITTSFETGFVGNSYPQNRQVGAQATYDKRFYVWQDLVQYYSDERLKEKTGTLVGALDAIKSWTPFKYVDNALANSFNFGSNKTQIGLSAQEVEAFYPELVELAPFDVENDFSDETNPRRVSKSGENYLTLNYTRLVPILVQAIKEQQAKIEELENRINNS